MAHNNGKTRRVGFREVAKPPVNLVPLGEVPTVCQVRVATTPGGNKVTLTLHTPLGQHTYVFDPPNAKAVAGEMVRLCEGLAPSLVIPPSGP